MYEVEEKELKRKRARSTSGERVIPMPPQNTIEKPRPDPMVLLKTEELEMIKNNTRAIQNLARSIIIAGKPEIQVKAPMVNIPKHPSKWLFTVHRNNMGLIETIEVEATI